MSKKQHFIESRRFLCGVVPAGSGMLGAPLSVTWLLYAHNSPEDILMGMSPVLGCAAIGFILFGIVHRLGQKGR